VSDIDKLTLVVFGIGSLLIKQIHVDKEDWQTWGFAHLTFDLLSSFVFTALAVVPIILILVLHQ
jgi:hypothetical protein